MQIVTTTQGHVLGVHSWTGGFRPIVKPTYSAVCLREKETLAHACWLARHVSPEAADEYLDRWAG